MNCAQCGMQNRTNATFCDACGARLALETTAAYGELFVGREHELSALTKVIEESAEDRGRIAMLSGEPGIGKTRTAEVAAEWASAHGIQVLWGRCHEAAGAPPYWPWVQLIRGWLEHCTDGQAQGVAAGRSSEITGLISEIRVKLPNLPPIDTTASDDVARFQLFDFITSFWHQASQKQPLLLVFDDLHWADTPTLKLLEFLSHEVADSAILLLATFRDIEVSREHPLSDTLADLSRQSGFLRLQLTGLNLVEASQFMAMASGKPLSTTLATSLYDRTEGNPLFLAEMARHIEKEGTRGSNTPGTWTETTTPPLPNGIREAIGRRLNHLSADCNDLLSCAAVIGQNFDLSLLGSMGDKYPKPLQQALLEEALAAHIIRAEPAPGCYQFSHALIRETLYEEIPNTRRSAMHAQIGLALENLSTDKIYDVVVSLAHHFSSALPAGDADKALEYLELAGRHTDAMLAFEEAVRFYKLALQTLDRINRPNAQKTRLKLCMLLGQSLINAGKSFQAMESFRKAADLAREQGAAEAFAHAAINFEEASWRPGMPGHVATSLLRSAYQVLGKQGGLLQAKVLAAMSRALVFTGDLEEARQINNEAETMARNLGDHSTLVFVLLTGLAARWGPGHLSSRLATAREAIDLAEQIGDRKRLVDVAGWYMFDLMEACQATASLQAFELQNKLAHELHQPYWLYVGTLFKATLALFHGEFERSETLATSASEQGASLTRQDVAGVFGLQMFNLRREQGRLGEVEPLLCEFLRKSSEQSTWRPGLAILYAELNRKQEALAEFEILADNNFAAIPRDALWPGCLTYLAEVCVYLEDRERAAQLYEHLLAHADYNIVVGAFSACYGAASRLLGMLATVLQHWDDATSHFESAIDTNRHQNARPWLAHSQHEYARMLLQRGESDDADRAVKLMNEALSASREMGMRALEQRINEQLQKLTLDAHPKPHPGGLSPREIEVLQLVATGKSNREIANTLFRSENTIANHMRHILEKTGTANRAEAVAFAARNGLTEIPTNSS